MHSLIFLFGSRLLWIKKPSVREGNDKKIKARGSHILPACPRSTVEGLLLSRIAGMLVIPGRRLRSVLLTQVCSCRSLGSRKLIRECAFSSTEVCTARAALRILCLACFACTYVANQAANVTNILFPTETNIENGTTS